MKTSSFLAAGAIALTLAYAVAQQQPKQDRDLDQGQLNVRALKEFEDIDAELTKVFEKTLAQEPSPQLREALIAVHRAWRSFREAAANGSACHGSCYFWLEPVSSERGVVLRPHALSSLHLAATAPRSAVAELGVVRRCYAHSLIHTMNTRTFIISLLLAATSSIFGAPPLPTQPTIDSERLVRVYVLLKNAEQMATGGVALSKDDLTATGRTMSADALKKECAACVDRSLVALSSGPTNRRPETFAYMKNAMLRLTLDREEDHGGHLEWANKSRDKVSAAIREYAKKIKEALTKI